MWELKYVKKCRIHPLFHPIKGIQPGWGQYVTLFVFLKLKSYQTHSAKYKVEKERKKTSLNRLSYQHRNDTKKFFIFSKTQHYKWRSHNATRTQEKVKVLFFFIFPPFLNFPLSKYFKQIFAEFTLPKQSSSK